MVLKKPVMNATEKRHLVSIAKRINSIETLLKKEPALFRKTKKPLESARKTILRALGGKK
ncbi:hypothetical protein HN924_00290 [Candidatus Woesearchaeota archaeon]|jgi:hypothetical protein|nr:hypothetical protein [Candidatus Woesearchaeota archaeon]MBT7062390.1 hypothetical protein [Candidatus Woesearchaeota archaeon]MBT7402547.1 hypothetical protein [Candidatus Woesearchaeota archaeon]